MLHSRLKICGITRAADARRAVEMGVSMLGFNFYPGSKRYIAPQLANKIIRELPCTFQTVGILVKPTFEEIVQVHQVSGVQIMQVYPARETDDFNGLPFPVIRAVRLRPGEAPKLAINGADMLLLDAFSPKEFGGTGQVFDWSLIPKGIPRQRLILAGGITVDNITTALRTVQPAVIDVASGAEVRPGIKDFTKIRVLLQALAHHNLQQLNF